jgi:uridylate kinase
MTIAKPVDVEASSLAPPFRRVLLKLSGEALMGTAEFGLDAPTVDVLAKELVGVQASGVELALVIGGGNVYRGMKAAAAGMDRATGDYMGMLATVFNSLAVQEALERNGADTRVLSALDVREVAEPYIRRRAIRHLEKGRVVIFGAGAGMPYFSTDTVSVQRALETHCHEVLMGKNGVDGVYSADPRTDPDAVKLEHLTYTDALVNDLGVMDGSALSLCRDNDVRMRVFGLEEAGNVTRALRGEKIGTLITAS